MECLALCLQPPAKIVFGGLQKGGAYTCLEVLSLTWTRHQCHHGGVFIGRDEEGEAGPQGGEQAHEADNNSRNHYLSQFKFPAGKSSFQAANEVRGEAARSAGGTLWPGAVREKRGVMLLASETQFRECF